MFRATCLATPLRDTSHETLHSVTYVYLATAENVARQVAETIVESRTRFYFLLRFQATFHFVGHSNEPVAKCDVCDMFRATCLATGIATQVARKIAQCDRAFNVCHGEWRSISPTKNKECDNFNGRITSSTLLAPRGAQGGNGHSGIYILIGFSDETLPGRQIFNYVACLPFLNVHNDMCGVFKRRTVEVTNWPGK